MESLKSVLLSLIGPMVRPVAKLMAKGAVKLVLLTKNTDDDALLREMAKEIVNSIGE